MRLATILVALSATVALAAPPIERWSTPCGGHVGTCLIEKSKYNVHKKSRPTLKNECICTMLKQHPECAKEGYICGPPAVPLSPPAVPQSPSAVPTLTPRAPKHNGIHVDDGFHSLNKEKCHADRLEEQIEENDENLKQLVELKTRVRDQRKDHTPSENAEAHAHIGEMETRFRTSGRELRARLARCDPNTSTPDDILPDIGPPDISKRDTNAISKHERIVRFLEEELELNQRWQAYVKETFVDTFAAEEQTIKAQLAHYKGDISNQDSTTSNSRLPEHPLMNNTILSKFDNFDLGATIATRWVEPSHGRQRRERSCIMSYARQGDLVTKNERLWQLDFCMASPDVPVSQAIPEGWEKKATLTDVDKPSENCYRFKSNGSWSMHCKNGEGDTGFGRED